MSNKPTHLKPKHFLVFVKVWPTVSQHFIQSHFKSLSLNVLLTTKVLIKVTHKPKTHNCYKQYIVACLFILWKNIKMLIYFWKESVIWVGLQQSVGNNTPLISW